MSSSSLSATTYVRPTVDRRGASELSGTTAVSGRLLRTHDFVVVRGLGAGKFGTVFLVDDIVTERQFAMKVVPKVKHQMELARGELQTMLNVSNTQWCSSLRGCFQDSENVYFLLDYFAAGDLQTQLERAGPLSDHQKRILIAEMIVAVEELHALDIIHRDVKPGNLLVSDDGHIVLADFGMSRDFNAEPAAHRVRDAFRASPFESVSECGTPCYMSPDVWQGKPYSFEADLWAIAVCLHELFLGRLPFNMEVCYSHEDMKTFVCEEDFTFGFSDHIGMDLWDILNKMFRKDRNFRPTIAELKAHKFFNGIDWDRLARRELPPPLQPKIVPPVKEYDSDIVFSKIPPHEGRDPFHYVDRSLEDFSASPDLPSPLPPMGTIPRLSPPLVSSGSFSPTEFLETLALSPLPHTPPSFITPSESVELSPAEPIRFFPVLKTPAPYAPSLEVERPLPVPCAPTPGAPPLGVALAWFLDGYRQLCFQLCL